MDIIHPERKCEVLRWDRFQPTKIESLKVGDIFKFYELEGNPFVCERNKTIFHLMEEVKITKSKVFQTHVN